LKLLPHSFRFEIEFGIIKILRGKPKIDDPPDHSNLE
jgi:hypothetical protein